MTAEARKTIVIGAGIVGVCCAIELHKRGHGVTLIDRGEPGAACSFGNAGILASQASVPFALPGILREVPRMLFDPEGPLVVKWAGLNRTLPWVWRFVRSARMETLPARADAMSDWPRASRTDRRADDGPHHRRADKRRADQYGSGALLANTVRELARTMNTEPFSQAGSRWCAMSCARGYLRSLRAAGGIML